MPHYYFDLEDTCGLAKDDEGHEFATEEQARHEAVTLLPEIARDQMRDGERQKFVVTVRDGQHRPIYRATLTALVERLKGPPDHT